LDQVAEEYRIAYQQLQAIDRQQQEVEARMNRDFGLALARYERVFVKLSHLWSLSHEAYPYPDTHDQVRKLYDAFGPRRLVWGSDWPLVESYCG